MIGGLELVKVLSTDDPKVDAQTSADSKDKERWVFRQRDE